VRRLPVKARMGSPPIVEVQIPTDRGPGLADRVASPEIHLLVLDRSPEPFDEDVVPPRASAIHADGDPGLEQHAGEGVAGELVAGELVAGELRALVGVEDLGPAMPSQS